MNTRIEFNECELSEEADRQHTDTGALVHSVYQEALHAGWETSDPKVVLMYRDPDDSSRFRLPQISDTATFAAIVAAARIIDNPLIKANTIYGEKTNRK